MNKNTAIQLIENTFSARFDENQFTLFIKNLLNDLEQGEKVKSYSGQYIWDDFKEHINAYKRIGKYTDPNGEALDVLIVEVKNRQKLERARTTLRNFVIKHLNKFEKDHALVAFFSKEDDKQDWRFSYIKLEHKAFWDEEKGKVKTGKEFTPAKRYSFLVGVHEKAYTAKNQLLPLLQNVAKNPTLEEIEAAFSIEKVTDEFFEQYKNLYIKLSEHFENDGHIKAELDKANIDIPRFTKKLLGQIVFLYFLQKKGWLGVPKNERWGNGDKKFIQTLYNKAVANNKNFFKDYLQYLFYEALAKERKNTDSYYEKFNCRIPFLNGGLFEPGYDWEKADISIPNSLFRNDEKNKAGDIGTGILDVFDRYNFTIKEDEPLDKEVAVDPEMLGKVFENMLEITERKSKGAFYTPREIVHFMCQESLIHYLDNALEGKIEKADIETYIRHGHFALENDQRVAEKGETETYKYQLPSSIRQNADLIDQKLAEIRICDPAIGSGAFPVGLLHELVTAHLVIKPHLSNSYLSQKLDKLGFPFKESVSESRFVYRLKRHIIQECIYGVDIDASAIDIARLRLWLSLVVDEDDLDPIETLPNLDYKIIRGNSLIGLPQTAMRDLNVEKQLEELKEAFYNETDESQKKVLQNKINFKIRELLDSAERYGGDKIDFDFKLFFSEVWREKGGFDVIIGNPPYIQLQKKGGQLANQLKHVGFETFVRTGDIYSLFYEKGVKLLKEKGILCYITSNKWMRAGYGEKTRSFFTKYNPLKLLDLGGGIFESATVDTNILLLQKASNQNHCLAANLSQLKNLKDLNNLSFVTLKNLTKDNWVITSEIEQRIKAKIEAKGKPLKDWDINIYRGILTGYNKAFVIDTAKRNEILANCKSEEERKRTEKLIKPLLRGRDIKRYRADWAGLWLIGTFPALKLNIDDYPTVKNYLKSFGKKLHQTGEEYIDENGQKQKSRKKTGNKWFETQDQIGYHQEFEKEKIIFQEMVQVSSFLYDDNHNFYCLDTGRIITGKSIKYLVAIFNSKLFFYAIKNFYGGGGLGNTGVRMKHTFFRKFNVPKATFNNRIEYFVEQIHSAKEQGKDTTTLEQQIDYLVYKLYDLSYEEVKVIDPEISLSEEAYNNLKLES
ncbi:Eco57I restriction-modification methylase domain-containing protein [Thermophagus xiamenensis]|uniref:site-specific DNA-methyltransferase (adenine-specific) n=1 Tax=Thermophagus xiamenensis TaxID=385682 RepID=A0A1I1XII2_9BACT|nr:Eco57I restriction-modification methylase domain-containing protein [Thermophagus xiamenensis]SFE06448.1 TaqI-like C-terminal specificity domain-containing protein [Thermophagus xiamenensis]